MLATAALCLLPTPTIVQPTTVQPTIVASSLSQQELPPLGDKPIPADTEIVTTESGLKYSILKPGTGTVKPLKTDLVVAHYNLWFEDGKLFDSSHKRGTPFRTKVNRVIPGWQEGLTHMTEGAVFKFTIPWELGYGEEGGMGIPPKATLIFEVELLEVIKLPEFHQATDKQVTLESGLKYETVKAGEGDKPAETNALRMSFAVWTLEGQLVQCTEETEQFWEFGRDSAPLAFMQEAMGLLHPGERCRFEVPPALLVRVGDDSGRTPPEAMVIEMELLQSAAPLPVPEFALLPDDSPKTASGLQYQVLREGTGKQAAIGSTVTVHYAGWLTDGTLFDSSYPRSFPAKFGLQPGGLIQGWIEGVPLMKVGAIYKFTLSPTLGYGPQGSPPTIPPNSTLVFQVELVAVE